MKTLLLTGASGLVGNEIGSAWVREGGAVRALARRSRALPYPADFFSWDASTGEPPPPEALRGVDAVLHLAGENIAEGRWTAKRRKALRDSRVRGIQGLLQGIEREAGGGGSIPSVFLTASAVGIYGDRGDAELDESSAPGEGFLADLCREWESSLLDSEFARRARIRTAAVRFGLVLSREGGALARLLPLFRRGLGASLGDGKAWMSFIGLPDLVEILLFALRNQSVSGPLNAVLETPARNREFTEALARTLGVKAPFRVPAWALRLGLGEASSALLSSTRVFPRKLRELGFRLRSPSLEAALREAVLS